jgi:membrane protease subunit HflK
MGTDDQSGGRKNPWGKPGPQDNKTPWGGGGPSRGPGGGGRSGGGGEPPDLDEMLRRAQDNFKNIMPGNFQGGQIIILAVLGIIGLWLASGLYIVEPGEHAVIQRFGAWNRTQDNEGLGYRLPSPIEEINKIKVNEIRLLSIGFQDAMGRAGSSRVDVPEESLMLTSDRNIVDLDLVVQWNIKSAEDFLFNIDDQEGTIKKVAESAIREVAGQTDMFQIITNKRMEVADRAKKILQENLDEYKSGVNITQVLIERAEVHPDVQDAFQDVQSAKQDAEDVQNRAQSYREDIIPKARGRAIQMQQEAEAYKQSVVARASGDADRFKSMQQAYANGQDVTRTRMYLETMEQVLKNANKIIMDDSASQGVVPYLPLNALDSKRTQDAQP